MFGPKYTSKSMRGFYAEDIHGPLTITIVDPAYAWPLVNVELQPDESVVDIFGGTYTNETDAPIVVDLPDTTASPDTVVVPNPDTQIPADAVEISFDEWQALLNGQTAGKVIEWGDDGYPMLVDPPPPSPEQLAAIERAWRDAQLAETDGMVSRHRDEVEAGATTTLTPEQYSELQQYRQALRNWPQTAEFPLIDHRPPPPLWLAEQLP
ncbi:Caudovirales tail fiber assembly protein [compost metagenome]